MKQVDHIVGILYLKRVSFFDARARESLVQMNCSSHGASQGPLAEKRRIVQHFDYVIVGAGAAGCVLASRLSEDTRIRVLLIEAGEDFPPGSEPADILDTFPSSYYNQSYMWPGLRAKWRSGEDAPTVAFDQGRVIGGGSTVMGMVALRGTPADYDEWAAMGAAGWGWNDVLPYFSRLERDLDFGGPLHGAKGPVTIRRIDDAHWPPLSWALRRFADSRGLPFVADMNADFREGCGSLPISSTLERRCSSASAYLTASVRARNNLKIASQTTVVSLIVEDGRVCGVTALESDGEVRFGAREVILSAGAIQSPAILMRAGIGPADRLGAAGVTVRADAPGVGANLQNHPVLFVGAHLRPSARQPAPVRPHAVSCIRFSSTEPGAPGSDLYVNAQSKSSWSDLGAQLANLSAILLKPTSRGRVELDDASPSGLPRVVFNFLDSETDRIRMRECFKTVLNFVAEADVKALLNCAFPVQFSDRLRRLNRKTTKNAVVGAVLARTLDIAPGLQPLIFSTLADGAGRLDELMSDDDKLDRHMLANVGGTFHVAGTCRMGSADDVEAVVDPSGRVHAIEGLRVVDASIMPTVPRGNTNIPTIMLAEKIADAIRRECSR